LSIPVCKIHGNLIFFFLKQGFRSCLPGRNGNTLPHNSNKMINSTRFVVSSNAESNQIRY